VLQPHHGCRPHHRRHNQKVKCTTSPLGAGTSSTGASSPSASIAHSAARSSPRLHAEKRECLSGGVEQLACRGFEPNEQGDGGRVLLLHLHGREAASSAATLAQRAPAAGSVSQPAGAQGKGGRSSARVAYEGLKVTCRAGRALDATSAYAGLKVHQSRSDREGEIGKGELFGPRSTCRGGRATRRMHVGTAGVAS